MFHKQFYNTCKGAAFCLAILQVIWCGVCFFIKQYAAIPSSILNILFCIFLYKLFKNLETDFIKLEKTQSQFESDLFNLKDEFDKLNRLTSNELQNTKDYSKSDWDSTADEHLKKLKDQLKKYGQE